VSDITFWIVLEVTYVAEYFLRKMEILILLSSSKTILNFYLVY